MTGGRDKPQEGQDPWSRDEPQEYWEVLEGLDINPHKKRDEGKLDTGTLQSWLGDILSP